jgi:hypothetical protein
MKRKLLTATVGICLIITFSSQSYFSSSAPVGYTGEFGNTCAGCHSSFALNSGGGNVVVNGLPTGSYNPGQSYPISVTISHGSSNRTRWGFALAARNTNGEAVGTFTSTNSNAALISDAEIGHQSAVVTPALASYTYTGINWVAPSSPTPNDFNLNFYVVGNAANNNSSTSGDFIYSSVINRLFVAVPVVLTRFTGTAKENFSVLLQWETAQEQNSDAFFIERSTDGQNFTTIARVAAAGNSSIPRQYAYTDLVPRLTTNARALYRLKQVDRDGSSNYSATVVVQLKTPASSFLEKPKPNITDIGGTITTRVIAAVPMQLQIVVTDGAGKRVYMAQQQATTGANIININTGLFARSSGKYYLTVTSGKFKGVEPIVIR